MYWEFNLSTITELKEIGHMRFASCSSCSLLNHKRALCPLPVTPCQHTHVLRGESLISSVYALYLKLLLPLPFRFPPSLLLDPADDEGEIPRCPLT